MSTKEIDVDDDSFGTQLVRIRLKDSHGGEESEWPEWLRNKRHFPVTK